MNKKELNFTIPEQLSEITLGQYQRVSNLTGTDQENAITMVSVLCNISKEDARSIPLNEFNEIAEILAKTINKKSVFRSTFTIGETKYGMIPNFDDMSIGEYIDLDMFIRDEKDLHKAMTVLFRRIKYESHGQYDIVKYTTKEDYDIMLEAPLDVVRGVMVFFWNLSNELLKAIPQFLEEQVDKGIQSKQISMQSGDGIQAYLHSLTDNLEKLMKLQKKISINV